MAKKLHKQQLRNAVVKLSHTHRPEEILHELSVVYEEYSIAGKTEAEVDFWLKCSRSTANLASGMNKWLYEMAEDEEDEE